VSTEIDLVLQLYSSAFVDCTETLKLMACFYRFLYPVVNQFLIKTKKINRELILSVFMMENQFVGLILNEMRGLVFDLAARIIISHNFNKTKKDGILRLAFHVS
jgi:hypothetical protein